jgi:hypothetical protein
MYMYMIYMYISAKRKIFLFIKTFRARLAEKFAKSANMTLQTNSEKCSLGPKQKHAKFKQQELKRIIEYN